MHHPVTGRKALEKVGLDKEIRSGVVEGEKVATQANFLIDSESRLRKELAQGRRTDGESESQEIKRRERGDAAAEDERHESEGGDHGVGQHVAYDDHGVGDAERACRSHIVEIARAQELRTHEIDQPHPGEQQH